MTRAKLLEIGDIWQERTYRLFQYMQDESVDDKKRIQAARLFYEMQQRVSLVFNITIKLSQPRRPPGMKDLKLGGIRYKLNNK